MLPALAGRLQDILEIRPLDRFEQAEALCDFYIDKERAAARALPPHGSVEQGRSPLFSQDELRDTFRSLMATAADHGDEGVTPRNLLHALYEAWNKKANPSD